MVTKSRQLAHQLLSSVEIEGAYPNIVLPKMLESSGLDKKDRGFVQELAYGCLRMQLLYDAIIDQMTSSKSLDLDVLIALRLGIHEFLHMRTGDHAVVDQYVELVKTFRPKASGLVNALLRRLTREKDELLEKATDGFKNKAVTYSHPKWVIDALAASRELDGKDGIDELLKVNNESPQVQMVALPPAELPEGAKPLQISHIGFEAIDGLDLASYRYQDQGSQLVTQIAAAASPDGNWLDMCAGPGGKASLLAAIASQRNSSLTAIELYEQRAKLVEGTLSGFDNTQVHAADATTFEYPNKYELILIDAPCTGLGAIRRKPESRHTKKPSQIQNLNQTQKALLAKAAEITSPGGVIAYITCSPVVEETTAITRWFIDSYEEFELLPWYEFSDIDANRNRRTLQLWTDIHNSDCMFLALFQKR